MFGSGVPPVVRRLLIALVVIVVLLVAADRIGDYVAERTAGDTIQSSQHLTSRPGVDIAGFPFLTQLAAGNFDQITVTAKDVPVGERLHLLDISQVRVVLHKLSVSRDFNRVHAETADATATVSYRELGKTLGLDVGYAGAGRIKASKSVTVGGQTVRATLTTQPQLVNGALSFASTRIDNAAQLGGAVAAALNQVFHLAVPLQGIPFKIRVKSLRVEPTAVYVDLTGADLTYSK
jgi:LmeA-like phospholipid-binding